MKPEDGATYWVLCLREEDDDGPPTRPVQATARVIPARRELPGHVYNGSRWELVTYLDDGNQPERVVWTATDTGHDLRCWRSFPSKSEAFAEWRGLVLEYIEQAEHDELRARDNAVRARAMLEGSPDGSELQA